MKPTKRILTLCVILALAGIGIIAASQKKERKTITLGAILPLSGTMSKAGNDIKAALEIAKEDLSSEFPNVHILFEDDAFKLDASVSAFHKLTNLDRANAIIGPLNGSAIEAVRKLADEKHIVAFTPWGAGNSLGGFLFKNSVEADAEAKAIATLAVQQLGFKRLGIVYLQNDFGLKHLNSFKSSVEQLGGAVVIAEPIPVPATDFHDQLLKVKNADVQGLYIVHNGANVGRITKQAKELGIETQFFGQYATESSDLISVGGDSLEGLIYTFTINEAHHTDKQKAFIKKFEQKTVGKPQIAAYNAYDIYHLLVTTLSECNLDSKCAQNKLASLKSYSGVSGDFSYEHNTLIREFFLKTIRNGNLVSYER